MNKKKSQLRFDKKKKESRISLYAKRFAAVLFLLIVILAVLFLVLNNLKENSQGKRNESLLVPSFVENSIEQIEEEDGLLGQKEAPIKIVVYTNALSKESRQFFLKILPTFYESEVILGQVKMELNPFNDNLYTRAILESGESNKMWTFTTLLYNNFPNRNINKQEKEKFLQKVAEFGNTNSLNDLNSEVFQTTIENNDKFIEENSDTNVEESSGLVVIEGYGNTEILNKPSQEEIQSILEEIR